MSILETLTEGIVNRNMEQEGAALLNKWTQTGLLEGLNESQKSNMAVLLENQAKSLLKEASSLAAGDVAGFAAVAFPIVRRVFAGLIANDLVSVQPMSLPSGLIFFLDFVYSDNLGAGNTQTDRFGNAAGKSIYGTDQVGSGIIDGVDLLDASNKADLGGPGRNGTVGYAYGSATGSLNDTVASAKTSLRTFLLNGAVAEADAKKIQYDPDLLSITNGSYGVAVLDIAKSELTITDGDADYNNLSAFVLNPLHGNKERGLANTFITALANHSGITSGSMIDNDAGQVRRLTQLIKSTDPTAELSEDAVRFVISADNTIISDGASAAVGTTLAALDFTIPIKDQIDNVGATAIGSVV